MVERRRVDWSVIVVLKEGSKERQCWELEILRKTLETFSGLVAYLLLV
jgi:hypothetical protein